MMASLLFWMIVIFLFMLFFVMPRVLYISTLIYYALKPRRKRKAADNYHLRDFKEMRQRKIVLR